MRVLTNINKHIYFLIQYWGIGVRSILFSFLQGIFMCISCSPNILRNFSKCLKKLNYDGTKHDFFPQSPLQGFLFSLCLKSKTTPYVEDHFIKWKDLPHLKSCFHLCKMLLSKKNWCVLHLYLQVSCLK